MSVPVYSFTVEYFQINCSGDGAGESAIALLVRHADGKKDAIDRAVLIDCGWSVNAVGKLVETLETIQGKYGEVKFDAVSLSHWDQDHYHGFVVFMQNSTYWTGHKCKWFKYDATNKPLTHLYGQAWDTDILAFFCKPARGSTPYDAIPLSFKVNGVRKDNVCLGNLTTENVLGANIFNNTGIPPNTFVTIESLGDLLKANPLWDHTNPAGNYGAPGLYAVGVNNRILGPDKFKVVNTNPNRRARSNAGSILLLLVWEGLNQPKVSLYSGGDSEWQQEENLARWLNGTTISAVKVGHHGSRPGTSTNFISAVKPDYFLISAGRMYGHPVPELIFYLDAWCSCQDKKSTSFASKVAKRIYSVCFPYYLGLCGNEESHREYISMLSNYKYMSTKYLVGNEKGIIAEFQKVVEGLYGVTISTPLDQLKEDMKDIKQASLQRQILTTILRDQWGEWGALQHDYFPSGGSWLRGFGDMKIIKCLASVHVTFNPEETEFELIQSKFTALDSSSSLAEKAPMAKSRKRKRRYNLSLVSSDEPSKRPRLNGSRYTVPRDREVIWLLKDIVVMLKKDDGPEEPDLTTSDPDLLVVEDQKCEKIQEITTGVSDPVRLPGYPWSFQTIQPALDIQEQVLGNLYLPKNSNEDFFLCQTQSEMLQLENAVILKAIDTPWTELVSSSDELANWWSDFFFGFEGSVTSFRLSGKGNQLETFIITSMPFVDLDASPKLVFTSNIDVLQNDFGIDKDILSKILGPNGLVCGTCELVMGLDIASSENILSAISLSDLYTLLELSVPDWLAAFNIISNKSLIVQKQEPLGSGMRVINALWFMPGFNYTTTLRLHLVEDKTSGSNIISQLLSKIIPGCSFDLLSCIGMKSMKSRSTMALPNDAEQDLLINSSLMIHTCIQLNYDTSAVLQGIDKTKAYISLHTASISVCLRWDDTENPLVDFVKWIEKRANAEGTFAQFEDILNLVAGETGLIIRQARFEIEYPDNLVSFALDFQASLSWGVPPSSAEKQKIPFIMTFSWQKLSSHPTFSLIGRMWKVSDDIATYKLSPDNPLVPPPLNPITGSYSSTFSIKTLPGAELISDALNNLPDTFPTDFSGISIEITKQGVAFSGTMMMADSQTDDRGPSFPLMSVNLDAFWEFSSTPSLKLSFNAISPLQSMTTRIDNLLSDEDEAPPAPQSTCLIRHVDDNWVLEATVVDLNGKYLYSLFPKDDGEHTLMKVIEDIDIPLLSVTYTYDKISGNHFTASGLIRFGDTIDLDLEFKFPSNDSSKGWEFSANLSPESAGSNFTLGTLMSSIAQDLEDILPAFLFELSFTLDADSRMELNCLKCENGTVVLSLVAEINGLKFSFVQMLEKNAANVSAPKRILRFSVDTIPAVNIKVPLVSKLPQPFDEMECFWLSDDFTKDEIDLLNATALSTEPLPYVDPTSQISKQALVLKSRTRKLLTPSPVVLTSGCHFLILDNSLGAPNIVLEYSFHAPPKRKAQPPTSGAIFMDGKTLPTGVPADKAKTAPYIAKFGPLSISGLGLRYGDGKIAILVDASVSLGPLIGTLNGFSLSIPLANLIKLEAADVSISIQGIGFSFEKYPLSISGMLIEQGLDDWAGGISINYHPFAFMAGGLYQRVKSPGSRSAGASTVLFVFLRVDGPLVELEFASISNITGGFGYNCAMTFPNIGNVIEFPFLKGSLKTSELDVLKDLLIPKTTTWFFLKEGSFWLAAGLVCSAFQVLDIQAVATVSWGGGNFVLGVVADCVAKVPFNKPSEEELFLLVELSIIAVVNQENGIFHCEGNLQPTSFVLNKSCHLTGGFALCYWFQNSGHEGDWVFTVGGYHSAYHTPAHYPVPSRLAISWKYDDSIHISGEAFFAITPKVCMGGGKLSLTFQDGVLHAWLNAWVDFLANYRPFTFVADIGVSVGIGFTIHIWFFNINFNVHFGASIHLQGPPVAGYVFVDWDIISFTIYFGESYLSNTPLQWDDMWELLKQVESSSLTSAGISNDDGAHIFACVDGLTSPSNFSIQGTTEFNTSWDVTPGIFSFTVKALFPITRFTYEHSDKLVLSYQFDGQRVFVKPMQIQSNQNVSSELHIKIIDQNGEPASFRPEPIVELVPTALWGPYSPENDPSSGKSPSDLLQASNSTVSLLMGIRLNTPNPELAPDSMLPFPVQEACSFYVFDDDKTPTIPMPAPLNFTHGWAPDLNAPVNAAKAEWQNASKEGADIVTAWAFVLDGGRSDGYAAKLYGGIETALPAIFDGKWAECFPVSPLVSKGSGI